MSLLLSEDETKMKRRQTHTHTTNQSLNGSLFTQLHTPKAADIHEMRDKVGELS